MEDTYVQFITQLLTMVNDLTVVPYAVALITLLVSLVKRLPLLAQVQAGTIHLVIQVVFWVIYAVLNHFGHGEQLQEWTEAATIIMQTLLPLIVSALGGTWLYDLTVGAEIPIWGYKRS